MTDISRLRITPPSKEELVDCLKTMTNIQVSNKYYVSIQTVYEWKRIYGLISTPFKDRVTDKEFIDIYTSTHTIPYMMDLWDVSKHTIYQRAKRLKLKRPEETNKGFYKIRDDRFKDIFMNEKYSIYELAVMWNISVEEILVRAKVLGLDRRFEDGKY